MPEHGDERTSQQTQKFGRVVSLHRGLNKLVGAAKEYHYNSVFLGLTVPTACLSLFSFESCTDCFAPSMALAAYHPWRGGTALLLSGLLILDQVFPPPIPHDAPGMVVVACDGSPLRGWPDADGVALSCHLRKSPQVS